VPFAVILGEEELTQGKVRVKELGLREGHPEKDGVLVDMGKLVVEVSERLLRKGQEGKDADTSADAAVSGSGEVEKSNSA
jgi:histidyl-tRNA synthetase